MATAPDTTAVETTPPTTAPTTATGLAVHVVLDRSGSMEMVRDDTIGSFNAYKAQLAKDTPDARLSLTLFGASDVVRRVVDQPVGSVPDLNRDTYVPSGGTPLYDAIGREIGWLDAVNAERKALVILTDGQENMSREYSRDAILKQITDRKDRLNWLVMYLGANQDAFAEGGRLGIDRASTMSYQSQNMAQTMAGASASTARFSAASDAREGRLRASFTDAERRKAWSGDEDKDDVDGGDKA